MARLPLNQAITRFRENEGRVDEFTNGDETTVIETSDGARFPSLRNYFTQISDIGTGWMGRAETAAGNAANSQAAAAISEGNAADSAAEAVDAEGRTLAAEVRTVAARDRAETAVAHLNGITAIATTGAAGSSAVATYDPATQLFSFSIPRGDQGIQGFKGDKGDPFVINAVDTLANRGAYDAEPVGFAFLSADTGEIYFRVGESGWSAGAPFGKGDKGDKGDTPTVDEIPVIRYDQLMTLDEAAQNNVLTSIGAQAQLVNITQTDAEGGTSTSIRGWSAQRVHQAATAVFNSLISTYYTKAESDDKYYTKSQVDTLLGNLQAAIANTYAPKADPTFTGTINGVDMNLSGNQHTNGLISGNGALYVKGNVTAYGA